MELSGSKWVGLIGVANTNVGFIAIMASLLHQEAGVRWLFAASDYFMDLGDHYDTWIFRSQWIVDKRLNPIALPLAMRAG